MRPEPGEVLHFSEDPTITRFVPHVAATARQRDAYVWAVDAARAPAYWFPRQCPRVLAWLTLASDPSDRERILGPGGGERVHAIEYRWLDRLRTARLFAYRLPAEPFTPFGSPEPSAHVATEPVTPLGPPEPVGDLLRSHEEADIQLRVLPNLWSFWDAVVASTLGFSGIRLRNAQPRWGEGASPPLGPIG
ncbi:hypothetical protein SAMN05421810_103478 [Amycolatopsis arida]|uniref:Uncharacterized protein n=1 Tax=Amycolatopsis arida TaxID=587909 RepID=A0A1I5TD89_9PSEU|nr:DUF6886 family protein [Amycolatopsis arida]TDX96143.1 hypothetical protein CLV69_103279 [Amycolatopsis arida]SFP80801.1 hypothetical protein SAMN05421810_103478 [Amycolatopsis arida]